MAQSETPGTPETSETICTNTDTYRCAYCTEKERNKPGIWYCKYCNRREFCRNPKTNRDECKWCKTDKETQDERWFEYKKAFCKTLNP
jgi:hypothetical protein